MSFFQSPLKLNYPVVFLNLPWKLWKFKGKLLSLEMEANILSVSPFNCWNKWNFRRRQQDLYFSSVRKSTSPGLLGVTFIAPSQNLRFQCFKGTFFLFSLATTANLNPECVGITPEEEDVPEEITAHLHIQRRS